MSKLCVFHFLLFLYLLSLNVQLNSSYLRYLSIHVVDNLCVQVSSQAVRDLLFNAVPNEEGPTRITRQGYHSLVYHYLVRGTLTIKKHLHFSGGN